jgi:hypothetical protein
MNITRTIPSWEDPEWLAALFAEGRPWLDDWPFAQALRGVEEGDFLYVIYRGRIYGRFEIAAVEHVDQTATVGPKKRLVRARTVVWVRCPGEPAGGRNIPRRGHRNARYDDVPEWGH